jgi:hypothetical protein
LTFKISKAFPPDRDDAVAELLAFHDDGVDAPANIYRQNGELRITIFGAKGDVAWEYPLDEWTEAIQRAIDVLGD